MRIIAIRFYILFIVIFAGCEQAEFQLDDDIATTFAAQNFYFTDMPALDFLSEQGDLDQFGDVVTSIDHVTGLCGVRPSKTMEQKIVFDPPGLTCPFNQNGNLGPRNFYFQARIEQEIGLQLPEGAVICDIRFSFAPKNFLYDDHFIFLMNRTVLAASYDFTNVLPANEIGFLKYDWSNVAGTPWDTNLEAIYCPQLEGRTPTCIMPGHDQQGIVNLELDSRHIHGVMSNGIPQNQHRFRMVTIGDNNQLDCEHTGMEFDVLVNYIE